MAKKTTSFSSNPGGHNQYDEIAALEKEYPNKCIEIHPGYSGFERAALYFSPEQWAHIKRVWHHISPKGTVQDLIVGALGFSAEITDELRLS